MATPPDELPVAVEADVALAVVSAEELDAVVVEVLPVGAVEDDELWLEETETLSTERLSVALLVMPAVDVVAPVALVVGIVTEFCGPPWRVANTARTARRTTTSVTNATRLPDACRR